MAMLHCGSSPPTLPWKTRRLSRELVWFLDQVIQTARSTDPRRAVCKIQGDHFGNTLATPHSEPPKCSVFFSDGFPFEIVCDCFRVPAIHFQGCLTHFPLADTMDSPRISWSMPNSKALILTVTPPRGVLLKNVKTFVEWNSCPQTFHNFSTKAMGVFL